MRLVTWPMNASEAGGDLALIQTPLLFSFKYQLVSRRILLDLHNKSSEVLSKQGHLEPCCHSETKSLNIQL